MAMQRHGITSTSTGVGRKPCVSPAWESGTLLAGE
jgi:hypothetical protein